MSPAEINALPERVRQYIHDLETRCDPTGEVQTRWSLTEQRDALVLVNQEQATELARLRAVEGAARAVAIDATDHQGFAIVRWPLMDDLTEAIKTPATPDPRDARIAALEDALRPFAYHADVWDEKASGDLLLSSDIKYPVRLRHMRTARTTLRDNK